MSDFVFNISKGRVAELYNRVKIADPSTAALVVVAVNVGATSDATLKDLDTLAAVISGGATEVTNSGYVRKVLSAANLNALSPDDTDDWMALDIPVDPTWTAVAAGTGWTDLILAYRPATASPDSACIPLTQHDFAVTPDGSDITAVINAAGFYKAA
jgi:hypothetical protein